MKKKKWIAIALLATSLVAANGTVAWLFHSKALTNTFTPAKVTGTVVETFDKKNKENVKVQNTSDIPVYIRVALVPTWKDGTNATALKTEGTYTMNLGTSNKWIKGSDGFYYYKEPVAVKAETDILIQYCSPKTTLGEDYQGKQFELDVIANLIQADPIDAVKDAWGVRVSGGNISK